MGSISRTQNTPLRARAKLLHGRRHLGRDLRGVRGACAQHQLDLGREVVGRRDQMRDPLLPGDPPDEGHDRASQVDAELVEHRVVGLRLLARDRIPDVGVDPVAHHVHPVGIQRGIRAQHVVTHARADCDHRVGGLDRGLLHP